MEEDSDLDHNILPHSNTSSMQSQQGLELSNIGGGPGSGRTSSSPPAHGRAGFNPMYSMQSDMSETTGITSVKTGGTADEDLVIGKPVLTSRGSAVILEPAVTFNVNDDKRPDSRPLSNNFLNTTRSRIVSINSRRYEGSKVNFSVSLHGFRIFPDSIVSLVRKFIIGECGGRGEWGEEGQ